MPVGMGGTGAGPAGGGGFGAALSNAFKNRLLLQILAAGGLDIATRSGGKNLNAVVQQNVQSQSYIPLLTKLLSGDVSAGSKVTMDENGLKIQVAKPQSTEAAQATAVPSVGSTSPLNTVPSTRSGLSIGDLLQSGVGAINPIAAGLSDLSPSDLAGLTPQDITQALQLRFGLEEMKQRKVSDLVDAVYKQGYLDYLQRQGDIAESGQAIDLTQAETARMNAYRQWLELATKDERTDFQKNYEYAKDNGFKGSPADWHILANDPETIRLYNAAVADGSFKGGIWDFIKQRAQAGATNIQLNPIDKALQLGQIQARLDVHDPSKVEAEVDRRIKTTESSLYSKLATPEEQANARAETKVKAIDQMITSGGGVAKVRMKADGRTMVWDVTWTNPDGTKTQETIEYAIY